MLIHGKKIADYAKSCTMRDMLRYSVFYMTLLLQDEDTQVHGASIILEDQSRICRTIRSLRSIR